METHDLAGEAEADARAVFFCREEGDENFLLHIGGDAATSLDAPDAVVLTESAATRYFGDANPMGEPLVVTGVDTFTVTGVMEDVPPTSHFRPGVVASFRAKGPIERFYDASAWTYALLEPGVSGAAFDDAMADFVDEKGWRQPGLSAFHAQPLTSIHLHSHLFQEIQPNGSAQTVWILAIAALLILGVACSNFVTMSTARAVDRAASVGVRWRAAAVRMRTLRSGVLPSKGALRTLRMGTAVWHER